MDGSPPSSNKASKQAIYNNPSYCYNSSKHAYTGQQLLSRKSCLGPVALVGDS